MQELLVAAKAKKIRVAKINVAHSDPSDAVFEALAVLAFVPRLNLRHTKKHRGGHRMYNCEQRHLHTFSPLRVWKALGEPVVGQGGM